MLCCTSSSEVTEVLSSRGLTHVPQNLSQNLVTLDLSNNNITAIQINDFRTLKQAKTINLSYNQIQTLHELSFEHVSCLQELDLSFNNIVHLPHSIFSSNQKLTKLYLKKNRLQVSGDLSKAQHILDSKSLIYLDISFCNITYTCESLKGLPNLKALKTEGNHFIQENVEIKNPPKNLRTMKIGFCNSSTAEEISFNLQKKGVEDREEKILSLVCITLCVVVFIIVVTWYSLNIICKNRRANKLAIARQNSIDAIQNRPLPQPPSQDGGYEVPITPSHEFISPVTSNNVQLSRNCGYFRLPSAEDDSLINTDTATYHVSMGTNRDSAYGLSGSTEYPDGAPYPSSIYIYSGSDGSEEEENNLPVPPMDGNDSISPSPYFSGANHPSTSGIPPRPCQMLGYPQDEGYLEKKKAPTRPTPNSPASPTENVTTFRVKKVNFENVFVSSTSIMLGQGS
jgi:hypothetical protein